MKSIMLMSLSLLVMIGCSPSNTSQAAGTHNLSKGQCIEVPCVDGQCRSELANEEMTQTHCEMVGGQFIPNDHRKSFWF